MPLPPYAVAPLHSPLSTGQDASAPQKSATSILPPRPQRVPLDVATDRVKVRTRNYGIDVVSTPSNALLAKTAAFTAGEALPTITC